MPSGLAAIETEAHPQLRPSEPLKTAFHHKSDDEEKSLPFETAAQLVDFEEGDNENPINLSSRRKWLYVVLVAFMQAMV